MKMVKCLPEFEYFYCILEKRNFISKIRRSKVTDYVALNDVKSAKLALVPCSNYMIQLNILGREPYFDL